MSGKIRPNKGSARTIKHNIACKFVMSYKRQMARALRVEYAGAVYHVMCRGNNGQDIFLSNSDRECFLQTLEESCLKTGWRVHAYVLMDNHYHLLLETPEPNLVAGMKWLQGTYTQRFNKRNGRCGHLFQGRYKSLIIDPEANGYFSVVGSYIHLNPVRAALCSDPCNYLWCSCRYYADEALQPPDWLALDRIRGALGLSGSNRELSSQYQNYIRARAVEELNPEKAEELNQSRGPLKRGWIMGNDAFRNRVLDLMEQQNGSSGDNLRGEQRRMHGEHQAENYIKKALSLLNMEECELIEMKNSCLEKQAISWLLKNHTAVTAVWIARRLGMKNRVNVSRAAGKFSDLQSPESIKMRNSMLLCTG